MKLDIKNESSSEVRILHNDFTLLIKLYMEKKGAAKLDPMCLCWFSDEK